MLNHPFRVLSCVALAAIILVGTAAPSVGFSGTAPSLGRAGVAPRTEVVPEAGGSPQDGSAPEPGENPQAGAVTAAPFGLESLYDDGFLLEDRNGDGHLDYVRARLALPDAPTDAEVAAAADIAARLGYETMSMDLPMARVAGTDGQAPVIALGPAALSAAGADPAAAQGLEPGAGALTLVDADTPIVSIAGGDDAGTRAAALAMAGHLPHLWNPEGPTLADVTGAVGDVLATDATIASSVAVERVLVQADMPGLDRVDIGIEVGAAQSEAAQSLLDEADEDGQLRFEGLRMLRLAIHEPTATERIVWVSNSEVAATMAGSRPGGGDKAGLSLANLYTNSGFFSDTDDNLIPDRVDVVLSPAGDRSAGTVDLAARLGLEAAGVTIPVAKTSGEISDPEEEPPLVLIGRDHSLVQRLIDEEKLEIPALDAGQGWIHVVRDAFDERSALVVVGADRAGLDRALGQVSTQFPHLWSRGKDRPTVEDVEDAVWRAVSARSPIGQAATALYKLETLAERVRGRDLESVRVSVHVEKADEALYEYIRARAADLFAADAIDVSIDNIDVQNAAVLIDEEIEISSEVDTFWERFRAEVLPAVSSGDSVAVRTLLSEPPEIREQIRAAATRELIEAGAEDGSRVIVLSAYKQGYSWLYDEIRPRLEGQSIGGIQIRFAELEAPAEWPQQAMYTPSRWLLEAFPIDEVLARDMGLDLEQIAFEMMPPDAPAYEVIVTGSDGAEILREAFEPRLVLRDYFDRFPDYEKARVTTGWIHAEVGGRTVIDERIVTDLERFWDHFQGDTLMRLYDNVMLNGDGKPRAADAPHFGELRVDVSLSEPDYQIGIDKEQIAPMEALHEEIYFGTLHFFDVMGRLARGQALNYPGRVIPVVRPKADGAAGTAKITLTGFAAPRPRVDVEVTERGQRPVLLRRDIPEVSIDRPAPLSAVVDTGRSGLESLGFYVKVDFERDRRDEFARRTSADSIDARITNAEQTAAVFENAAALRAAGLYRSGLAFAGLGRIGLTIGWERDRSPETERTVELPDNGVAPPLPDAAALLPADDTWRSEALVQWDTPMPPGEAYSVLAKMNTFAEATAYQVGSSYLGKPVWALDMMAPLDGTHWSQNKATTLKPTVVYSARQHANEVSSTSHVLKLAEIVLAGDEYPDALDKVNIVVHPITNPDGAQLAYDLHQITPDHMLHAGYLGSLGVDVTSGQGNADPMYPETKVRPKLWNTWLPDIFLNPHGYPSHEWVQVFSEYAGWVRTRATESRSWWGMRGWFIPGFSYLDDPDYPDHKTAAFEIRDRITEKINAAAPVRALNERAYDRYRRYGFAWDQDRFKLDFSDDVLIYTPIKGGTARNGTMSNPRVTVWSGSTEAPDETAYGEWLQLVATAGLQWDKALLEYLLEGNHEINRDKTAFSGGMSFSIDRPRPATAPDEEQEEQERR